jgi:hypothetical protein
MQHVQHCSHAPKLAPSLSPQPPTFNQHQCLSACHCQQQQRQHPPAASLLPGCLSSILITAMSISSWQYSSMRWATDRARDSTYSRRCASRRSMWARAAASSAACWGDGGRWRLACCSRSLSTCRNSVLCECGGVLVTVNHWPSLASRGDTASGGCPLQLVLGLVTHMQPATACHAACTVLPVLPALQHMPLTPTIHHPPAPCHWAP